MQEKVGQTFLSVRATLVVLGLWQMDRHQLVKNGQAGMPVLQEIVRFSYSQADS